MRSSRLASAERSLGDTTIRAPFNGIVAKPHRAHAATSSVPGAEMFRIIDPSSMRLEASVPSEDLSILRVGANVDFTVRGYDRSFTGRIERIAPQADPTTRQVPIYVAIPNPGGRLVAGLFAEGRVVSQLGVGAHRANQRRQHLRPQSRGCCAYETSKTERVQVTLGLRDPRREQVQIASGLTEGDVLLRGAAQGISRERR